MSQRNESDLIRSPLLRLPAEIRQQILQLVIGGKTIHLAKIYHGDFQPPYHKCRRSLCIARNTRKCVQRSSSDWYGTHHKCVSAQAKRINFSVFSTNRQIHHECFHIFWRTLRFLFADPETLAIFLTCLNEAQKQNVRHLVICYRCTSGLSSAPKEWLWDWKCFRSERKEDWGSNKTAGKGFYFPQLATVELYLQLHGHHWEIGLGYEAQVGAFHAAFGSFEVLRLLQLTSAFVTLSYAGSKGRIDYFPHEKLITKKERVEIANTFRDRLLDPAISEEILRGPLVDISSVKSSF